MTIFGAEVSRINGAQGSGPTSDEGKSRSSQNALKQRLFSKRRFIGDENPVEFESLLNSIATTYQPATATEWILIDRMVMARWRLGRLERAEAADAPCSLNLLRNGRDVSETIERSALVAATARATQRPSGDASQYIVAASAAAVLSALTSGRPRLMHLPGPLGLEGGYPVSVSQREVALALPGSVSRSEARELMLQAQRFDGIDSIDDRGDIRLTEAAREVLRSVLGIEAAAVTFENALEFGAEFRAKLAELGTKAHRGA